MKTFTQKRSGFVNYVTDSGDVYGFMGLQDNINDTTDLSDYMSFQAANCDMDEVWEGEWTEVTE
jgi:hypothetical protein